MTIQTLPLSCLTMSKMNVRRTERDADVAALAEDIASCGLKQNLVVVPAHFSTAEIEKDFGNKFEVIAGGRRYQALRLLADTGRIEFDFPVPVLVEAREAAAETSLSENLHRVAMNPADEFEAFATIAAQQRREGASDDDAVAYVAKRFGVTVKHVQGRLRLASLAPEILEALRSSVISLDSAKAYAGSADHEHQIKVFKDQGKPNAWRPHHPDQVRQALRGITLSLSDPLVKFAGLDAYRAAGGRTETEMFMGTDGEERVLDVKLAEKLAREKAEPMVAPLAKEQGFKAGLLANGVGHAARMPKAPAGLEHHMSWRPEPSKTALKKSTAVYAIDNNGIGLIRVGIFVPISKPKDQSDRPTYDWKAERRKEQIFTRAAQTIARNELANMIAGADWPDALWPDPLTSYHVTRPDDDDHVLVQMMIRVPAAAIEAELLTAEEEHNAAIAAEEQAA